MALNGISTLMIASGTTLTKNVNPPHTNTEIVAPFSAIWSLNYTGALGAINNVSYKLYVTSLGISSALTLTSHQTGDYAVTAGNFLYDEYGTSIGIIKGNTTIDNYMAKAAAVCGSLSNTIITAATYKGTWNAFTNTPTLTDGVGTLGDAYDTTVTGTSGAFPAYSEQDWRIYDGSVWQRVEGGAVGNFTDLTVSGTTTLSGLTASTALALNASKEVVSVTNTGTGNNVLATCPTLVTPALGTPSSGNLANCTFPTLNQNTSGTAAGLSSILAVASGGTGANTSTGTGNVVLSASPTLTGTVAGASLSLSSLTSGRVPYATTSGLLTDSANLLYSGTDLTVYGLTVGRGAGGLATNTAVGASAMTGSGGENTGIGSAALGSNTTGVQNVAVGRLALQQSTTTQNSVAVGYAALQTSSTGNYNTALGALALNANIKPIIAV